MGINKKDVIRLLEKIALYLELKGENPFKISAYRRAAQGLEQDERALSEIDDFTKIKGIGKGTNTVITEYIEEKTSTTLQELEEEVPVGLVSLLNIPGLGGKRIAKLYQELGVTNIETLKEACKDGRVENLPGFGKKTADNILEAIEEHHVKPTRLPISMMLQVADEIEAFLRDIPSIEQFSRAGSLRRMRETVRDLDFVIATIKPEKTAKKILEMDNISEIIANGETKVSVVLNHLYGVHVDFRLVHPDAYPTALHHFTGSKDHNVAMRQLAKQRGEKINEYGVEIEETGEIITFSSEKEFFTYFNLHYIPPELRENKGELDAFKDEVPLIQAHHIRGDLHMHTTWSDGGQSIEEMVQAAINRGYEYIAITDHSKYLRIANGLDEERLFRQQEEIARLNEKYSEILILSGIEMDILPDGRLDFSDDVLKQLDLVIASIHSQFNQSEEKIMDRLNCALENPYVDIIAHPTGRLIGRREPYQVNVEKLIEKAKETNTALEINANPNRLDLSYKWANLAEHEGVHLAINTDAHQYQTMNHMKFGISVAKKGWVKAENVLNTWTVDKLMQFLNRSK